MLVSKKERGKSHPIVVNFDSKDLFWVQHFLSEKNFSRYINRNVMTVIVVNLCMLFLRLCECVFVCAYVCL